MELSKDKKIYLLAGIGAGVLLGALGAVYLTRSLMKQKTNEQQTKTDVQSPVQSPAFNQSPRKARVWQGPTELVIKPPLPASVTRLLEASKLCFLSTSYGNDPHLSLMNFTYFQPDEVVIMTTKVGHRIVCNPSLSLIVCGPNLEPCVCARTRARQSAPFSFAFTRMRGIMCVCSIQMSRFAA